MKFSRKAFKVLEALNDREITTQRQLSEHTGISLGQVNYVVKSLIAKGLVKIGNFSKSKQKIGYAYLQSGKDITRLFSWGRTLSKNRWIPLSVIITWVFPALKTTSN